MPVTRRSVPPLLGALVFALSARSLHAQSGDPTLTVAAAPSTERAAARGTAGPYTLTATCPTGAGPHCAVWIEQDTTATGAPVGIQWQLVSATAGCPSHAPVAFTDVVVEPRYPVAIIPNGGSCTLTVTFRLKSPTGITEDVARNVSLYITR